jgi:hypothetical protein
MHKPILLTACFLLLAAPLARPQQTTGTYTMSVGGNAVSVENYTLTSEPNGALRAEAEISAGGGKQKTTTILSKGRLVSFLAQAGETKLISAAFDGPAVKLQIAGQDERRLTTKATVILENTVRQSGESDEQMIRRSSFPEPSPLSCRIG